MELRWFYPAQSPFWQTSLYTDIGERAVVAAELGQGKQRGLALLKTHEGKQAQVSYLKQK